MDNHVKELATLLSLKRRGEKEPNVHERKQFETSWSALVKDSGFSDEAESFLYDGFTYCGAEPFYAYMKSTESCIDTLHELYQGKRYRETCVSTSSILIHILALSLNDSNRDIRVIVSLIQQIPNALINKEGKLYGKADRAFKKYLFDKLKPNITYPNISEMTDAGIREINIRDFCCVINEIVGKMDSTKFNKKCQDNIHNVEAWLDSLISPKSEADSTSSSSNGANEVSREAETSTVSSAEANIDKTSIMQESSETSDSVKSKETHKVDSVAVSPELKQEIALEITKESGAPQANPGHLKIKETVSEQSLREAKEQLQKLQRIRGNLDAEVARLDRALADRDATITTLREQLRTSEAEIVTLKDSVKTAYKKADALASDVSQRDQMIDMLRRDRSHQSDETLKRLASSLQNLYMEYVDATSLEMSVDLGENMRIQLGEVFKILIAAGITF